MRVTITFDCPEENDSLREALDGWRWKNVVEEVMVELRRMRKYECKDEVSIEELEQSIREEADSLGLTGTGDYI